MSSSYSATSASFLWCASCHILVDNSSLPCPLCGLDSITEITDERILAILRVLYHDSSARNNNRNGDGDANLSRNIPLRIEESNLYISSPRQVLAFLAVLARMSRAGNPLEGRISESAASISSLPDLQDEPQEEGHSTGYEEPREQDSRSHEIAQPLGFDTDSNAEYEDNIERHRDNDEGFLHPLLEFIMHHVIQEEGNRYGSMPASKAVVAGLPTMHFDNKCPQQEDSCCAICREHFEFEEELKELPCKHFYHSDCILPWLELHSSCPLCRRELPTDDSFEEDADEVTGGSTEAGETSLALFEISGEGIHILSFVLFGAQNNSEENVQAHETTLDSELHDEEGGSLGIDPGYEGEMSTLESQERLTESKADSPDLDGTIASISAEEGIGTTEADVNGASNHELLADHVGPGVQESLVKAISVEVVPSNTMNIGSSSQLGSAQSSAIDKCTVNEEGGAKDGQTVGLEIEDGHRAWYERTNDSSQLNDSEGSFIPRVRNFFSWVFGNPSHTVSSNEQEAGRRTCW
ncbi:hypothetical protein KP509_03G091200 [Ceratopteris richardii]|uniref:RING-type E3 ubiquitin transferase n=5 Tax=Ceratopteris richardii TaxID=49495 RepID=A0A8T2V965_CERRI|nr:hypothetical protein KP509_03G091200 [Ceratopteris richardii]